MINSRAEAYAPATVANLGIGFDILGLALQEPGDIVIAERRAEPGAVILSIEGDDGRLSHDPARNTATIAANSVLKQIGASEGVGIHLKKNLPLASGLGSSAASAVAAAVAVNALFAEPLPRPELLPACLDGEAAVSGYHADNVAPSLLGGILLINGTAHTDIFNLPIPANLFLAMVTPDVAVPTAQARAVLPQSVPMRSMVAQTAGVARLIDALYRGDIEAMAVAMEKDIIVEPARAHLMPLLIEVRAAAKQAGAFGLVISGAGPTLCAVCDTHESSLKVAQAMKTVYDNANIAAVERATQVGTEGATVLKVE